MVLVNGTPSDYAKTKKNNWIPASGTLCLTKTQDLLNKIITYESKGDGILREKEKSKMGNAMITKKIIYLATVLQ